jgi:hypothetical protein
MKIRYFLMRNCAQLNHKLRINDSSKDLSKQIFAAKFAQIVAQVIFHHKISLNAKDICQNLCIYYYSVSQQKLIAIFYSVCSKIIKQLLSGMKRHRMEIYSMCECLHKIFRGYSPLPFRGYSAIMN